MERTPDIDIICPSCKQKAAFYGNGEEQYNGIIRPSREGKASCIHCGYNANFTFTNKDYFYQIPVRDRFLYARTKAHLITLRDYFRDHKKTNDPGRDFPGSFYVNRTAIIGRINNIVNE